MGNPHEITDSLSFAMTSHKYAMKEDIETSDGNLIRNIIGFCWGVLASLFFAISSSCTQVIETLFTETLDVVHIHVKSC